jgi:hypothetical protein
MRAYVEQDRKSKLKIKFTVDAVFDFFSFERFADLVEEEKKKWDENFSDGKRIWE